MKTFFALLLLLAVLVLARVSRAQPVGLGSRSPAAGEARNRQHSAPG